MEDQKECMCHQIEWSTNNKPIHIKTGEIYDYNKHGAVDCHTKVNLGIFNMIEYYDVCKNIPIPPKPVIMKKIKKHDFEEGIPPIPKRLFPCGDNNKT